MTTTAASARPVANHDRLVVFNLGLGRDSIAMLILAAAGKLLIDGRPCGFESIDVVVFSDTGAEWPYTYALIPRIEAMAAAYGFRFVVLAKPRMHGPTGWVTNPRPRGDRSTPVWVEATEGMTIDDKAAAGGYHLRLPIMAEYMRFGKIAITQSGACTSNHKVGAIRRFTDDLCRERFGVGTRSWASKVRNGTARPHLMVLGFAADEGTRQAKEDRPDYEIGSYPLIDAGITKADEQPILVDGGFGDVLKSGCIMCPFARLGTFWALRELHPDLFADVVEYEAAALEVNGKMHLKRGGDIADRVENWRRNNPDVTIQAVLAKGFSMCTKPTEDATETAEPTTTPEPFDADAELWAIMSNDARIAQLAGSVRTSRRALKRTDDVEMIADAAALATSNETRRQLESRLRALGWTADNDCDDTDDDGGTAATTIDALHCDDTDTDRDDTDCNGIDNAADCDDTATAPTSNAALRRCRNEIRIIHAGFDGVDNDCDGLYAGPSIAEVSGDLNRPAAAGHGVHRATTTRPIRHRLRRHRHPWQHDQWRPT